MANKQIYELPAESVPAGNDLLMLAKAGSNSTRHTTMSDLPLRASIPNAVDRKLGDKALETVSVKDFGAVGDGVADDTVAFAMATSAATTALFVPAGRYRLTSSISLPAGLRLQGAGKHSATLVGEHSGSALVLQADGAGMCRSAVEGFDFEIAATGSGILSNGEDVVLRELQFSGAGSSAWAIDLLDCRGAQIADVTIGGPARDFYGNGIRWRDSSPASVSNYGESAVIGADIRLAGANTVGMHFAGASGGLIANVMVAHARIRAPQTGGGALSGSIGLKLDSTVRSTFIGLSLEALEVGVSENGTSSALGASVANQYFGVSAISVTTAYQDSNAVVTRSVQQRVFAGCDNFPATAGLNDGDSIMPAGLWLQSFVSGENAVRLRCFTGHELIVDDGAETGSLSLDVGGSSPRVAPKQAGLLTRLYLGRGSTPSNNTMRDVTVEPVLRLAPRDSENPGTTTGQFVYADGTNWDPGKGEGFYAFERGAWRKLAFEV